MKTLTGPASRIIFAIPFGIFGIMHFMNADMMAGMVPGFIPGGVLWVYVVGLALVAASGAIIAGRMAKEAALGLAALMAIFILTMWIPQLIADMSNSMAMMSLLKDMGLMGGALFIAGSYDE